MTDPLISVIVPAYNAAKTIGPCLTALTNQFFDQPYEIIVIDDGSTDGTAEVARAAGATVISTTRARPAAARNAGIHAARGAVICCTDADCAPHPEWLCELTEPLADPSIVASKGSYETRQRQWVARFVQLEYEDKYDRLRQQPTIDFIDTYSAAYRRDVLLENGGFDTRFDYLEDQELSFRLAARGGHMVFREAAVVNHLHSATVRAYLRKKAIIGYWKAQVVRRHPDRAGGDSHTPPVMKVQMALAMLILTALAAGGMAALFWPAIIGWRPALALAPAGLLALVFLATTVPFVGKAWGKDRPVAWLSPLLLFGRAVALSVGYAWGVLHPRRNITGETMANRDALMPRERSS